MALRDIISSIYILPAFSLICIGAMIGIAVCLLSEFGGCIADRCKRRRERREGR